MIDKITRAGRWLLIALGAVVAVLFGARAMKSRVPNKSAEPVGKGPLVEQQIKEVETVNATVSNLNASIPPAPTSADTDVEDLVKKYNQL